MSAKKRAAKSSAEARKSDIARGPDPSPDPRPKTKNRILAWVGVTVLVALAAIWVYKKFIEKTPVTPLPPKPMLQEGPWESLVDGERIMSSVKRLVDLGPRVAGTEGSVRAQQMIKAELGAAGITDIREQKFTEKTPKDDRTFTNIIGVLPGKRPEGIAIAAHYDSKLFEDFVFVGANDAASAVGVIFELARKLKPGAADRELTYYFIFFDGEESFLFNWAQWEQETGNKDNTYGSRYFVRKMEEEKYPIKALILLDLVGDKDYSLVGEDDEFSPELLAIFKNASRTVFGVDFFIQPGPIVDDHDEFAKVGVPAIDIIDFEYGRNGNREYWHTPEDTLDKLSVRSLERTGTLVLKALPEVEAMVQKGLK